MNQGRTAVPAVDGWFQVEPPALLGSRCTTCGTYSFPKETFACRNPACRGRGFEELPLSRRGRLWSWTTNHYPPPAPYVAADPFEPYTIAAVSLDAEHMVVMGQVVAGVDPSSLHVGDEVKLAVGTLFSDDEHDYLVWRWAPV